MRDPIAESNERISDRATIRDLEDRLGKEVRRRRAVEARIRELEEEVEDQAMQLADLDHEADGLRTALRHACNTSNRYATALQDIIGEARQIVRDHEKNNWRPPYVKPLREALASVEEENDGA